MIEEGGIDRPGDAAVRSRQGRHALAALEGRRARLSLLPRPGPAAAGARRRVPRGMPRRLPELPDAKRKRYEGLGITPYNASVLTAEVETARWFDALLEAGAEPKQARELGRRRAVRRAQPPRRDHRREPGRARAGRGAAEAGRRRHDLRHDRQAGVRDHARNRRRRGDDRREARASSRPATPARSTPRSTRSSPPTPTRSPSTRPASSSCSASSSARR